MAPFLLGIICFAGAVQIAHAEETRTFKNGVTGHCLHGDNKLEELRTVECTGEKNQKWKIRNDGTIQNVGTKKCLEGKPGTAITVKCDKGIFQNWIQDGLIYQNIATGKCLDVNSQEIAFTSRCSDGDNSYQIWTA